MAISAPKTCPLHASILRTLTYSDIFSHPLTAEEIYFQLPNPGIEENELDEALAAMVADGEIQFLRGFYFLSDADPSIVDRRLAMEQRGDRMWRIARRVASAMRHFPFVRGIFISGQLCRYIADEASDIDYFIVTEPRRLWIVRTMFVLVRRLLLFNSRKYFCTNYYVTTDNLKIREHNRYTANEIISLKPIYNLQLFGRLLNENRWVEEFYPNFDADRIRLRPGAPPKSWIRPIVERLFPQRLATRIDIRLMEATRKFWRRKYPDGTPEFYNVALRTRRDESRAHPNDRSPVVLELYHQRLHERGIYDD